MNVDPSGLSFTASMADPLSYSINNTLNLNNIAGLQFSFERALANASYDLVNRNLLAVDNTTQAQRERIALYEGGGIQAVYPEFWFAGGGSILKGIYSAGKGAINSVGVSTWNMASPSVSRAVLKAEESSIIRADNFFQGGKYTEKVRRQVSSGDYHSFPQSVDGFASSGSVSKIIGGDNVLRWKLEIPGSYRGKNGIFEYIRNPNGTINHRLFVPNQK